MSSYDTLAVKRVAETAKQTAARIRNSPVMPATPASPGRA
jgi:hypothetical protein